MRRLLFYALAKLTLPIVLLLFTTHLLYSQATGHLLIIPTIDCTLSIDGEAHPDLQKGTPYKVELQEGEHYIQAVAEAAGEKQETSEIVAIEADKQKVLKLEFGQPAQKPVEEVTAKATIAKPASAAKKMTPVKIAEVTFDLPGGLLAAAETVNQGENYDEYPRYRYELQEGDKLLIDLTMLNRQGQNFIDITSYPDGNSLYSNQRFDHLRGLSVDIPSTGIYEIKVGTHHSFDRKVKMTVKRLPASEATRKANTKVVQKYRFEVVSVHSPTMHWVHSLNDERYGRGKSKIVVPVTLPPNTVEWFYTVSTSRNKNEEAKVDEETSLQKQLVGAALGATTLSSILAIAVDLFSVRPGVEYCNVHLVGRDHVSYYQNGYQFNHYLNSSLEQVKDGKMKVTAPVEGTYYLGISNPAKNMGINVQVEVVAVTAEEYFESE